MLDTESSFFIRKILYPIQYVNNFYKKIFFKIKKSKEMKIFTKNKRFQGNDKFLKLTQKLEVFVEILKNNRPNDDY